MPCAAASTAAAAAAAPNMRMRLQVPATSRGSDGRQLVCDATARASARTRTTTASAGSSSSSSASGSSSTNRSSGSRAAQQPLIIRVADAEVPLAAARHAGNMDIVIASYRRVSIASWHHCHLPMHAAHVCMCCAACAVRKHHHLSTMTRYTTATMIVLSYNKKS